MIVEKDEGAVIHQLLGLVQSMPHAALRVAWSTPRALWSTIVPIRLVLRLIPRPHPCAAGRARQPRLGFLTRFLVEKVSALDGGLA